MSISHTSGPDDRVADRQGYGGISRRRAGRPGIPPVLDQGRWHQMSVSGVRDSAQAVKGLGKRAAAWLVRELARGLRERRRRRAMKALLALDDSILDDLGLSRAELSRESRPAVTAGLRLRTGRMR